MQSVETPQKRKSGEEEPPSTSMEVETETEEQKRKRIRVENTYAQYQFIIDSFYFLRGYEPELNTIALATSLAISGPIKTLEYLMRVNKVTNKKDTQLYKSIQKTGISLKLQDREPKSIPLAAAEKFVIDFYDKLVSTDKNLNSKIFFGTLAQIVTYCTNFHENWKVTRVGEAVIKNTEKKWASRSIADVGLDPNRHMQLARGFGKTDISASTEAQSLGFATVLYMAQKATQRKDKWKAALDYHLNGYPRRNEIVSCLMEKKNNWEDVATACGDLMLILGQRYRHRYSPAIGQVIQTVGVFNKNTGKHELNKEGVAAMDFSSMECLKTILGKPVGIPSQQLGEHAKALYYLSATGGYYEDLGVMTWWTGKQIFTRRKALQGIHKAIAAEKNLVKWSPTFAYYQNARKGALTSLLSTGSSQMSSEPMTNGYRIRQLERIFKYEENQLPLTSTGNLVEKLVALKGQILKKFEKDKNMPAGQTPWKVYDAKSQTFVETKDFPTEGGTFYFDNE